ncbi:MAG: HAD family hydrolase [Chloroflexi bacterium]|nr:HAD family hydrolase [Chloroflexota bacterium]
MNNIAFDADLIVFDKDGTLIDFDHYWGQRIRRCGQRLLQQVDGNEALGRALFASLGYEPDTGRTDGDGPLATATMAKIYTIATVVLYQHGIGWTQAEEHVQTAFIACAGATPTSELLRELGPVSELFQEIVRAGARVAIITSDDHHTAAETLSLINALDWVSAIVGGDDDLAMKPAPDAFLHVCDRLDTPPHRAIMVGDTIADLSMAQRAGAGASVGVLSGVCSAAELAPYADFIIPSIEAIQVVGREKKTN